MADGWRRGLRDVLRDVAFHVDEEISDALTGKEAA
jgi:hypothetical protein